MGAGELRGSRPVLRGAEGETPSAYSPLIPIGRSAQHPGDRARTEQRPGREQLLPHARASGYGRLDADAAAAERANPRSWHRRRGDSTP